MTAIHDALFVEHGKRFTNALPCLALIAKHNANHVSPTVRALTRLEHGDAADASTYNKILRSAHTLRAAGLLDPYPQDNRRWALSLSALGHELLNTTPPDPDYKSPEHIAWDNLVAERAAPRELASESLAASTPNVNAIQIRLRDLRAQNRQACSEAELPAFQARANEIAQLSAELEVAKFQERSAKLAMRSVKRRLSLQSLLNSLPANTVFEVPAWDAGRMKAAIGQVNHKQPNTHIKQKTLPGGALRFWRNTHEVTQ